MANIIHVTHCAWCQKQVIGEEPFVCAPCVKRRMEEDKERWAAVIRESAGGKSIRTLAREFKMEKWQIKSILATKRRRAALDEFVSHCEDLGI